MLGLGLRGSRVMLAFKLVYMTPPPPPLAIQGLGCSLPLPIPHLLLASAANISGKSLSHDSPWARGGHRYHQRGPHFNGTMLFRNMNCNYFCLLDIPNW